MPGIRHSFFGCASDGDRMVFVARGHDGKGIFQGGKFHVIGRYDTEMQGKFKKSCEALDTVMWQWGPVRDDALMASTCLRTCVDGDAADHFYMCKDGDGWALRGPTWQVEAKIPGDVYNPSHVTKWQGQLLVIGYTRTVGLQKAYVFDMSTCTWTNAELLEKFSGHIL